MKAVFLLGFLLLAVVGFSQCSLLGAKLGSLKGKFLGLEKAYKKKFYSKIPLLGFLAGGGAPTTTTPAPTLAPTYPPPTLKCDVIWEEKVTPLCKTVHEKICKTDTKDHCHKIWEDKCWDEPVEHCTPQEECNHVLENVCKTEYTVTCDDEDGGEGYEAAEDEYGTASEPEHGRHRRDPTHISTLKVAGKKIGAKIGAKIGPIVGLKKAGKILGLGTQTTAAPTTLPPTHKPHPPHEEVMVGSSTFSTGRVVWTLCGGTACLLPQSGVRLETDQLTGSKELTLTALMSGGEGDCAWQHTQLFRCDRDGAGEEPQLKVTINLKNSDETRSQE